MHVPVRNNITSLSLGLVNFILSVVQQNIHLLTLSTFLGSTKTTKTSARARARTHTRREREREREREI